MNIFQKVNEITSQNKEIVLATVVDAKGSSPARKAFKMIIVADGSIMGSVGGGALEYEVVNIGRELIKSKQNDLRHFDLSELGMACGGEVTVFFEYISKGKYLYIFGGGHICQAISPIAQSLGFRITVVDDRPEVTSKEMHPSAENVTCGGFVETVSTMEIHSPAYALIVTNKHMHDGDTLKALLQRNEEFRYIGMIGSKSKVEGCMNMLERTGIDRKKLQQIYTPVGLRIGGDTPAEIAVSIMAEVIAVENNKTAPHMRD